MPVRDILCAPSLPDRPSSVAAGVRCTLANSAYNARELAFQYTDSGARIVFTSEEGVPVVRQTFQELGLSKSEADQRIIVLTQSLKWAGGPDLPKGPDSAGLLELADLLGKGALQAEERFDGEDANDTVYLCYSSGTSFLYSLAYQTSLICLPKGTTGKPKGVEVRFHHFLLASFDDLVY